MTFTCAMTIVVIFVIHHQWQHVHFKEYVYENMLQLEKLWGCWEKWSKFKKNKILNME